MLRLPDGWRVRRCALRGSSVCVHEKLLRYCAGINGPERIKEAILIRMNRVEGPH